jgi:hypothetical protein
MRLLFAVLFLATIAIPSLASAEEWGLSVEHKYSKASSIRVVEPEGYKVTVNGQTDTVPAVFNLADSDAYHIVKIASPNGRSWEKKVEVKAGHQTVVRIRHEPPGAEPKKDAPEAATFVGKVTNSTHACRQSDRGDHVFEFRLNNKKAGEWTVKSGTFLNVELATGNYEVRRWGFQNGTKVFQATDKVTVDKDGWEYNFGCGK